uniref:Uncharacterized protein n=1 Tax=Photinus pyralis TaxID=7054 RepID=A0A1Y1K529_PHOPY
MLSPDSPPPYAVAPAVGVSAVNDRRPEQYYPTRSSRLPKLYLTLVRSRNKSPPILLVIMCPQSNNTACGKQSRVHLNDYKTIHKAGKKHLAPEIHRGYMLQPFRRPGTRMYKAHSDA